MEERNHNMKEVKIDQIGIMGGGTNAALLCLEAKKKGIRTTIVDNDMYCPAAHIADEHLVAPLNKNALLKLIQRTKAIVFTAKLEDPEDYSPLLKEKIPVYPEFEVLDALSSRQRFLWKMEQQEIPIIPYTRLEDEIEVLELLKDIELPVSITKYYKSQSQDNQSDEIVLLSDEDLVDLLIEKDKQIEYWLVEEIYLESIELSVGVTRDIKGKIYTYGVAEDVYDSGSWIQSHIPARITKTLQNKATALAKKAIRKLGGTGTYTVNISMDKDKELYVRDIHPYALENAVYTNESCSISQYDHLLRTLLDMPLFPSVFDGVVFVHLENSTITGGIDNMSEILVKPGTNVYAFPGKGPNDSTSLYTFRADTWEQLEENIKV